MMRLFIIGFNKTGTTSLHEFFKKNNISSIHYDQGRIARKLKNNFRNNLPLLKDYPNYMVFSDMEDYKKLNYAHMDYFKELYYQYPDSKFILNTRNLDNWIKSRNQHENGFYVKELCNLLKLNKDELNDRWISDYYRHHINVKDFFKHKPSKLLVYDIEIDPIDKVVEFIPEYKLDTKYYEHLGKSTIIGFERLFKKIMKNSKEMCNDNV